MRTAIMIVILAVLLLSACSQAIKDIKDEDHVGKSVAVSGTVENVVKIGGLSAYTLKDENGDKIGVSAKRLPAEGDSVTASGTLMKDTISGYYIKTDE